MQSRIAYVIMDRLLGGVSARDAVFESLNYLMDIDDYEAIKSERDLFGFSGTLSLFDKKPKVSAATPYYQTIQFQVYCPELIGPVYDADDAHPLTVNVPVNPDFFEKHPDFYDICEEFFNSGEDFRTLLKLFVPASSDLAMPIMCFIRRS